MGLEDARELLRSTPHRSAPHRSMPPRSAPLRATLLCSLLLPAMAAFVPGPVPLLALPLGGPITHLAHDKIELAKGPEDSVLLAITHTQGMLMRATDNHRPAAEHPGAWKPFNDAFCMLLRLEGDSVLDDNTATQYLLDRGIRSAFQRPITERYPVAATFYNAFRDEETALNLLDPAGGRYILQPFPQPDSCCFLIQAVRTWTEKGGRQVAVLLERVGVQQDRYCILRFHGEPGKLVPGKSLPLGTFSAKSVLQAEPRNSDDGYPVLALTEVLPSKIFVNASDDVAVQWYHRLKLHSDSLEPIGDQRGFAYFGVLGLVLESLVDGDAHGARPMIDGDDLAARLGKLAWDKAHNGWTFVRASADRDTLVCSHPAIGTLRLVTGGQYRYQRVTDFSVTPLR